MEQNQNNGKSSNPRMDFSHAARILLLFGFVSAALLFASFPTVLGLALGATAFSALLGVSFWLMAQEAILQRLEQGGRSRKGEEDIHLESEPEGE